jgi:MSHA pilin protein MshC
MCCGPTVWQRMLTFRAPRRGDRHAGFTMIELIVVMILAGILGAVAIGRFFDNDTIVVREYSDQAKAIIRYGQKLAIAQNRPIYVSATANRFALCTAPGCGAGTLVIAPGGSNSGSAVTKTQCALGSYVSTWLCEGKPGSVALASTRATEAGGAGAYFFFDAMGRPFNAADAAPPAGYVSSFAAALTLTFTGGGTSYAVTIEPETGYVH